jgi:uncharacterized membrane protein
MPRIPVMPVAPGGRVGPQGYVVHLGGHLGALGILWTVLLIVLWAALVTVLVLLAIKVISDLRHSRSADSRPATPAESAHVTAPPAAPLVAPPAANEAVKVLEERFARGEISGEEYAERKAALLGS